MKNAKNRDQNGENNAGLSAGSELCSVFLGVYDSAPSRQSSDIPDEEQALVCAVLSSLLALSHSAKAVALQGEDMNHFDFKETSTLGTSCL